MCGIAGEVKFDGSLASVERVTRMVNVLQSRGPDDVGIYDANSFVFGHRRLKIIDLSDRGKQPMIDKKLNLAIVFNGCIYNHKILRKELSELGYQFFSSSDTEVILKAYHAWGKNCVQHFNGMFAFVIRELVTGRTFLARDRLGIKPLYLVKTSSTLRFASSLPALLKVADDNVQIDTVALHNFMTFHSVVPAPRTIIKNITKLRPATTLLFASSGECIETKYWEPCYQRHNLTQKYDESEWQGLVHQTLQQAVQARLTADVEVGVLLSGGLDSSLIVALLAEQCEQSIKTFSIGFENSNGEKGNEFEYSDAVAKHFSTQHLRIPVDSQTLVDYLPNCLTAMSEPMVSHDNIGFYLLSKHVSQHVKVVQSGQGADEIFAGYRWYPPMLNSQDPLADYGKVFFDRDHQEYERAITPSYLNKDFSREFVAQHFAQPGADRAIDKAMRLDTTVMLVEDPVKRVDNMTMAWGVEARVPFLDHNVVELSAALPPELKIKSGGKHILKQIARQILPAKVIDRPKGYFPVPALKFLKGKSFTFVKDILNSQTARQRGVFQRPYLDQLLDEPTGHITPLQGSKLWQIATLEAWLQTHAV